MARMTRTEQPVKHDEEKTKMHLLPPGPLIKIAEVFTLGANKYAPWNYLKGEGMDRTRMYDALQRHLLAWLSGEDEDKEWNKSHLAHAGCCLLMLMQLEQNRPKSDDRPKEIRDEVR